MGAVLSRASTVWPAAGKKAKDDDDVEAADAAAAPLEPLPSFLSRHAVKVAATAVVLYAGLLALLSQRLCTHTGVHQQQQQQQPVYLFGVMLCAACTLAWKVKHAMVYDVRADDMIFVWTHRRCLLLLATLALVFGFVSMVVGLVTPRYGGVCRDAFGVDSLAVVWADLMVSAPLLGVAIILADEGKMSLSCGDKLLLVCVALNVPAVVAMFSVDSVSVEIAMIVVATLLFAVAFYAFMRLRRAAIALVADVEAATSSREWLSQLQLVQARQYLASRLLVILPVFPLTYVLAVAGVIDSEVLQVVYIIAALLYKVSFIVTLSKTLPNATLYDKLISEVEWERLLNANKRSVLQFVFHEVRVPLNTLTLGISVIEGELEKAADPVVKDALQMMTGASQFMSDTLNTVLSISKVEEGAMELSFAPFVLKDLVNKVGMVLKGQLDAKNITLAITSPDATLDTVQYATGDGFRLEHVLANFLSNAIKFSPPNSTITIVVGTDKEQDEARAAAQCEAEAVEERRKADEADQSSVFTARVAKAGSNFLRTSYRRLSVRSSTGSASAAAASKRHSEAPGAGPLQGPHGSLDISAVPKKSGSIEKLLPAGAKKSGSETKLLPPLPAHLIGRDPKEIRWIEILVCDQGVGIPPEKQAKLFQAFSQIDAQALQQGQGSGLGLVFAQQIIELHGGKVVFRSELGKGSVFGFCIPFRVMTAEEMMAEGNQLMFRVRSALSAAIGIDSPKNSPRARPDSLRGADVADEGKGSISGRRNNTRPGVVGSIQRAVGAASDIVLSSVRMMRSGSTGEALNTLGRRGSNGVSRASNLAMMNRIAEQKSRDSARKSSGQQGMVSVRRPVVSSGQATASAKLVSGGKKSNNVSANTSQKVKPQVLSFRVADIARAVDEDEDDTAPKRVLLVDDTPSNSRMLKMLLEKRGFVCDLAEDGAVAVEMVKDNVAERGMMQDKAEASRHAYKLIFMDHQMPVMDGLEATQTLRTACNVSAIIVGCTGNTDERDQATFFAAGADYVLPKPVRLADVDKLVEYCRTVAFTSIPNTKLVMSMGVDSTGAPTSRLRAVPRNWKPSV